MSKDNHSVSKLNTPSQRKSKIIIPQQQHAAYPNKSMLSIVSLLWHYHHLIFKMLLSLHSTTAALVHTYETAV